MWGEAEPEYEGKPLNRPNYILWAVFFGLSSSVLTYDTVNALDNDSPLLPSIFIVFLAVACVYNVKKALNKEDNKEYRCQTEKEPNPENEQPSKTKSFFWAIIFGLLSISWIYGFINPSNDESPLLFFTLGTLSVLACIYNIRKISSQHKEEEAEEECHHLTDSQLRERYPHLTGKLEGHQLEMLAGYDTALLKLSFMLYLEQSTKIDLSEGSFKWDSLWDITEELLEHLEMFHEGSVAEHELAVTAYWDLATTAVVELIEENPKIEGAKLEVKPFTEMEKILLLFPKKDNHPDDELSFFDEDGGFPRKSEGSTYIHKKLQDLGL